jgi:hypothetical protein
MKTKLLKKVRKRYSINYYPKGVYLYGNFEKGPITILQDNHNQWRGWYSNSSDKQKALDGLMDELKKWILSDYKHTRKIKKEKIIVEKLWHV